MKNFRKNIEKTFLKSKGPTVWSVIAVSLFCCWSLSVAQQSKSDGKLNFQQAIRDLQSHSVSKTPGKDFGYNVFKVPEDVVHAKNESVSLVLRVTENEKGLWLQMVRVHVFGTRDGFALIRGINLDDKLIHKPSESLIHLRDLDAKELQKRTLQSEPTIEYR